MVVVVVVEPVDRQGSGLEHRSDVDRSPVWSLSFGHLALSDDLFFFLFLLRLRSDPSFDFLSGLSSFAAAAAKDGFEAASASPATAGVNPASPAATARPAANPNGPNRMRDMTTSLFHRGDGAPGSGAGSTGSAEAPQGRF